MARLIRGDIFQPLECGVFHCLNRTVRRAFLCGCDAVSGKNFEYRRGWLEDRIKFLAAQFGIDVLGFAVMSNHLHLVLRNRPDIVAGWSDREVARRWLTLCPPDRREAGRNDAGSPAEPTEPQIAAVANQANRVLELRLRLSNISWFMGMVAEPIARRANREDQCSGRFWEGRFKSVKLCDEAAILACSVYVDLNPIRAGIAQTPETSDHTSAQLRCQAIVSPVLENKGGTESNVAPEG